ncbi:metallophosphoesterase family protein [Spirochaeta isovalerica]|uniref:Icc protein n=1 Tax=Spirochaeta isovalerica TaxID=150 RepID=A0A841RIK8_9SPIO|nr:metallophosphoesterase [Spirochaeta isovalerica]MBB6482569.1 Icc protein [Spirochaeta isovalerica]
MSLFRIAQISDIHITLKQNETAEGIDVIANFNRILDQVVSWAPDLLVLTGDLCFTRNDVKAYEYVKGKLDKCGLDYIVMAGNHDKSAPLAKAFGYSMTGRDLYALRDIPGYRLIFGDSSRHRVSSPHLEQLRSDLQTALKPVLFIHHPPAKAGVPFMDRKYPLINMDQLQEVLYTYPGRVPVFCGHYHNEKEFSYGNLDIYMTPSTYFQISDQTRDFAISSRNIGWRSIELSGRIETEVHHINLP